MREVLAIGTLAALVLLPVGLMAQTGDLRAAGEAKKHYKKGSKSKTHKGEKCTFVI